MPGPPVQLTTGVTGGMLQFAGFVFKLLAARRVNPRPSRASFAGNKEDGMAGDKKLPGNHGQFGVGDATEAYTPLPDYTPPEPAAEPAAPEPDGDKA